MSKNNQELIDEVAKEHAFEFVANVLSQNANSETPYKCKQSDLQMVVFMLLQELGNYSETASTLCSIYVHNNKSLKSQHSFIRIGSIITQMLQHECSQRQAFKFFSMWFNLSERQIANYFYKFRNFHESSKENMNEHLKYIYGLLFFIHSQKTQWTALFLTQLHIADESPLSRLGTFLQL